MTPIAHPGLDVQTSEQPQPAVPFWFAETVLIADYLRTHGPHDALTTQVRLVHGRFGHTDSSPASGASLQAAGSDSLRAMLVQPVRRQQVALHLVEQATTVGLGLPDGSAG